MPKVKSASASNAQPSSVGTVAGASATNAAVTVQFAVSDSVVYGLDWDGAPQPSVVKPANR